MSAAMSLASLNKQRLVRLVAILVVLLLFWPMLYGLYWLSYRSYAAVDQTEFPEISSTLLQRLDELSQNATEKEKGDVMAQSLYLQLERELDSTFGWSANDLFFMPTRYLDNRASRQRGVIFATRMLITFFSTNMAKLGPAYPENPHLKEAREKRVVYGEDIWGFFRSSAEREFRKTIELVDDYRNEVKEGQAQYNARSDDLYNLLEFMVGEQFLGNVLGQLIQTNDEVSFYDLDDRVYYAQGVVLVVRDVLSSLVRLYPEIMEKGGRDNMEAAFHDLDRIASFDPVIVLRGDRDSLLADHRGKVARYLIAAMKRIEDVAQSIRR